MYNQIFDDMSLYITPSKLYISPIGKTPFVVILRPSGSIAVHESEEKEALPEAGYELRKICGILGMIRLISGLHLVVVTHRIFVGLIDNEPVWRLAGHDLIPLSPTETHLSEQQKELNTTYLSMIRHVLDTPYFYFSYGYDLTNSVQRRRFVGNREGSGIYDRTDKRFLWNVGLLGEYYSFALDQFTLPIIHGSVTINDVAINGHALSYVLISRRSVQNAGTRLFCRGINDSGEVANYVETEQIIVHEHGKVSFVQTRGSIPLYWSQTPNLQYKPKPQLVNGRDHLKACESHVKTQFKYYGPTVMVNLIDHKGAEDVLEKAFDRTIHTLSNDNVTYVSFDFHQECKKMRYDRLKLLISRIAEQQDSFGMCHIGNDGKVLSVQKGVFRTNCIDCLDRTNVVQSLIAKRSLEHSLEVIGVFRFGEKQITPGSDFDIMFKAVWADNADLISVQYSGTGALKTDFTRTGKRTFQGLLRDGLNSMMRYGKNNFADGFREDSINLFLGKYCVQPGEGLADQSPLTFSDPQVDRRKRTVLATVLFELAMLFVVLLYPTEYGLNTGGQLLAWSVAVGFTARFIARHRTDFVDMPKLAPKN